MNLEPVIQSEVKSEKGRQISYIIVYIRTLETVLTNLFADQQQRCKHRLVNRVGEEEGGTN